jgi:hypothetical protein
MMPVRHIAILCFLCFFSVLAVAQTIRGEVLDMDSKQALEGVRIENVYTTLDITSNTDGSFNIAATGGQLLEFKKQGYKTTRVRIPQGYIPSFFRIIIKKGISDVREMAIASNNRYDYRSDSARYHELYKHELEFPKMSAMDMMQSPFSALSSKNRAIWQFQEDYAVFEREKYVDRTFNAELITKFTGLTGDSLKYFMRRFRPDYEQLRTMNDYSFYTFIKKSVYNYRNSGAGRGAQ